MDSPLSQELSVLKSLAPTRRHELEVFLIHCIIVAGKSAPFGNAKTTALLKGSNGQTPFDYLRAKLKDGSLREWLQTVKTGNYGKMYTALLHLTLDYVNLETCTLEQLEAIPYIGLKTSRYFLMYTRPENETNDMAVIDTHALKWLKKDPWAQKRLAQLGVTEVPDSTPPRTAKKLYLKLQRVICEDAKRKGMTARAWDANNWDNESKFSDLSRARALAATA